jgi:hypothetical protein
VTLTTHTLAFFLSLFALWFLFQHQGVCPHCSGRGRHRSDCPEAEKRTRGDDES